MPWGSTMKVCYRLGFSKEEASALAAVAGSISEWQNSHFSVGGCGELSFTVGKIFEPRKIAGNGAVKNGYFIPFFVPFLSPLFVPFSTTTSCHNPPQPTTPVLCPLSPPPCFPHFPPFAPPPPIFFPFPPVSPLFPPFSSIFPHFLPFSPISPDFPDFFRLQNPFGECVDTCKTERPLLFLHRVSVKTCGSLPTALCDSPGA